MSDHTADAGPPRRGGKTVAIVLLLLIAAAGGAVAVVYVLNAPPVRPLPSAVGFTVERGETLASIAERLEQLGIIRS